MANILRADIYRILRGKALYITFVIMAAICVLNVFGSGAGLIGVTINTDSMEGITGGQTVLTGAKAARFILSSLDNIIYFLLPLFTAVCASSFACGAVKNEISSGTPRNRLLFAKWVLSSVLCVIISASYTLIGIFTASAANGLGDWGNGYFLIILKAFSAQLFLLLALNAAGVFLSFAFRGTGAVIGVYIALALVPVMLVLILSQINESFIGLLDYDITMSMKALTFIEGLSAERIWKTLAMGAVYISVSITGAAVLFKNAEIK